MAGRPKKQIVENTNESTQEVENVEVVTEVTTSVNAKISTKSGFNNISGIGCIAYSYFFYENAPVNMTTTFLPNVKGSFEEDGTVIYSHINS